ncbi:MAG: hypothetical protein JZU52_15840 [Lamprocystis purpurea]|jgi:hypothetical protein|uniref:hypothetical protein n=1 Tax=Lamprocystis purpurea TaxID=61598 RepID=UPI00036BF311|nr:hypothetical protein [Lamprocystis purpurea]MBV5275044.1 hypothetical protein [Lamprocystis purpurea]
MTRLCDIVNVDASRRDAAIRLDDGLSGRARALVDAFTPTHSSIGILSHLQKAVLANAQKEWRAMIWHGVYGSGKSHLGVLVGELVRNGTGTDAMMGFLDRLTSQGESRLCESIKTTFHPLGNPDSRPYLVVTLYGSPAPTLQHALLEGLYRALSDTDGLDPQAIMPKTEFAAALERLATILEHEPGYRSKPLADWDVRGAAFNLDEMETQLRSFDPEALETFKVWHPKVSAGAQFDPQALGGKAVSDAFLEAAATLSRAHGYNGIAVIWDEFGYALENLINQPQRNPVKEIFELQKFVETVCAPPKAHTLFIALTHKSLGEYGASTQAGIEVKNRLLTIEGRFGDFPVALKSSETEGYHLLSTLITPTDLGVTLLEQARPRAWSLAQVCARMPLFSSLAKDVEHIVTGCYPLHPVTAAGLFAIAAHAKYTQANRTVFTFFQNLQAATSGTALEQPIASDTLYGSELIRLPTLLAVYRKDVFEEYPGLADAYNHAVAAVAQGFPDSQATKRDILTVLLLARALGEHFQPTEAFLATTLFDAESEPLVLKQELETLRRAELIWRRDTDIPVWELEAESGTQIEPLIEQELKQLTPNNLFGYLHEHPDLLQDLFPQCGIHDCDPSPAGIIRSFEVRLVADLTEKSPVASDERLSALVEILILEDTRQAAPAINRCDELPEPTTLTYLWIPKRGLAELIEPLRRYLVIDRLLQQQAAGEGLARRLRNEWDKTRRLLHREIKERLGRIALERGDTVIKRLGDPDEVVDVTSWHSFTEYLTTRVQARYPKEVKVRTMNVNRLYNPENYKIKRTEKLIHGILHFDEQAANLRSDLFGENDGSEVAALIDGTLGTYSNALLIERADGWHLKTPSEADGSVGDLLSLIHDTVLDKRRKICELSLLRSALIAPPYGLPTAVMPIFTAVAIRKDATRLKWVNQSGAFESLLWDAFTHGSAMKLRFDTFKAAQLQVLNALHHVLRMAPPISSDLDEQARETIAGLRSYYGGLPDAVRVSGKLTEIARSLLQKLKQPGLDSQDIADCLLGISKGAKDDEEIRAVLRELFDSIDSIKDERTAAVLQVIAPALREPEQKRRIFEAVKLQGKPALAQALERADQGEAEGLSEVVRIIADKDLNQCSDIEIGRLSGDLQRLLEQAAKPELPPLSPPFRQAEDVEATDAQTGPIVSLLFRREQSAEETFKQELGALIFRYEKMLDSACLTAILMSHLDKLGSAATADCSLA